MAAALNLTAGCQKGVFEPGEKPCAFRPVLFWESLLFSAEYRSFDFPRRFGKAPRAGGGKLLPAPKSPCDGEKIHAGVFRRLRVHIGVADEKRPLPFAAEPSEDPLDNVSRRLARAAFCFSADGVEALSEQAGADPLCPRVELVGGDGKAYAMPPQACNQLRYALKTAKTASAAFSGVSGGSERTIRFRTPLPMAARVSASERSGMEKCASA